MANIFQLINQLSGNPEQILKQYGIPTECKTPESVAQYLLDNGKVSQAQINQANRMYKQMFKR
jgi:hypothetical protein